MKMKHKLILLCLLLFAAGPMPSWGQVGQWEYDEASTSFAEPQSFSTGTRPSVLDVTKSPNGGFVYVGRSENGGDRRLLVFEVDAQNNVLWESWFGGDEILHVGSITAVPSGGYALVGTIDGQGPSGFDNHILLVRIDASGNEMWSKLYGDPDWDYDCPQIIVTPSGGFAMVGSRYTNGSACFVNNCHRALVFLTDPDGNLLDSKYFSGPQGREAARGYSIEKAKTGGYVIVGTTSNQGSSVRGFAMRLDAALGVLWANEYPISDGGESSFYSIKASTGPNQSGWIVGGETSYTFGQAPGTVGYNLLLNNSGGITWAKSYPLPNGGSQQYTLESSMVNSGGYISLGFAYDAGIVATKLNSTGTIDWQTIYGAPGIKEIPGGMEHFGNGSFLFSGIRSGLGSSNGKAYVVKANAQGTSGCDEIAGSYLQYDVPVSLTSWTPETETEVSVSSPTTQIFPNPVLSPNVICDLPCDLLAILASPAGPYCEGDAVTLTSSLIGPTNTYTWTQNGSQIGFGPSLTIDPIPAGSNVYELHVTVGDTCELDATITLNVNPAPVVSAGHDQTLCLGEGTQLNGSATGTAPFTYSWTPSTGLSSTTIANPFCSPPSTTTYTLTVTDANGCSASDDVTVTLAPLPSAFFQDPGFLCQGDPVNLCVNGNPAGYDYAWVNTTLPYAVAGTDLNCVSFPANPGMIDVTVTVTTPEGCESTYQSSIEVNDCCLPSGFPFPVDFVWTNTSASAEGLSTVLVNKIILINGTFALDQNLILDDCKVLMGEDAKIDVSSNTFLQLRNSQIEACGDKMWDGIYLPDQSASLLSEGSIVRDAKNAVVSIGGGVFNIINSFFRQNFIHFDVRPFAGAHTGSIQSSELTCNGPLLQPYNGLRTWKAISVNAVDQLTIGNPASINEQNLISNADHGIYAQVSGLNVYNNHFENIDNGSQFSSVGTAVHFEGLVIAPPVNLNAGGSGSAANEFTNCTRGIVAINNVSTQILFNVMSQIELQAIQVYNPGPNSTVIQDNRITEWGQGIVCTDMGQSSIDIKRNRLDLFALTSVAGMLNEGIIVTNQGSSGTAVTDIQLNVIRYPQVGIRVEKRPNAYLRQNRVVFDQDDATVLSNGFDFSGIVIARSPEAELRGNICNRVISAGPATASMVGPLAGIRISDSQYSTVRYNTLDGFGNGIEVINQMADAQLECNFLQRCWTGVDFQNATIGDQGSPAANNGNQFYSIVGPHRLTGTVNSPGIDWYFGNLAANDPNPYSVSNFTDVGGVNANVCSGGVSGKANPESSAGAVASELSLDFAVFPNPSEGMVHLTWSGFGDQPTVRISDAYGRVVLSIIADSPQLDLALTELSKGMYFIHLDDGRNRATQKLILY